MFLGLLLKCPTVRLSQDNTYIQRSNNWKTNPGRKIIVTNAITEVPTEYKAAEYDSGFLVGGYKFHIS